SQSSASSFPPAFQRFWVVRVNGRELRKKIFPSLPLWAIMGRVEEGLNHAEVRTYLCFSPCPASPRHGPSQLQPGRLYHYSGLAHIAQRRSGALFSEW